MIEAYRHYMATVRIRRDLPVKPTAEPLDGGRFRFEAYWVIDEGSRAGEWAMVFLGLDDPRVRESGLVWIASGDLVDLEPAPGGEAGG